MMDEEKFSHRGITVVMSCTPDSTDSTGSTGIINWTFSTDKFGDGVTKWGNSVKFDPKRPAAEVRRLLKQNAIETINALSKAINSLHEAFPDRQMMGRQFYDRFASELKKQPDAGGHVPYYSTQAALDAARKAAGIE